MTFPHRGGVWRVEGLHKAYRCKKPTLLTIVSMDGKAAQMAVTALRKIVENKPQTPIDKDRD
jgi:hypothetical protein